MSSWEHSRHKILTKAQHPLVHDIDDFGYTNDRIPGVSRLSEVLDYIVAVIYPNYQGTVDSPGDLPVSADPNDYYLVNDDGDGRAAGYVWSVLDNAGQWIKRYDMDWSIEGVLAEAINRTLPLYVQSTGFDDPHASAGQEGQSVYGGSSANTHLTLHANAGDTGGARSGFVQIDDPLRPTVDNVLSLGTSDRRFSDVRATTAHLGTMTLSSGSITDSNDAINFGAADLTTSAGIFSDTAGITTSLLVGDLALSDDTITSTTGTVDFDNENLLTDGTLTAGVGSKLANLTFANGSITTLSATLSFGSANLSTSGTLSAGNATLTRLALDDLLLDGSTLSVTAANQNLSLSANGSGSVAIGSPLVTGAQTVTGTVAVTGSISVDNLTLDGATIASNTGTIGMSQSLAITGEVLPSGSHDLGSASARWTNLHISGSITSSGGSVTQADLLTLRHSRYRDVGRTVPAQTGDSLFYDATAGVWLASHPDTEIIHSELAGLTDGDAGHTQFVMLQGRGGGQIVRGGSGAAETLILESTSNASKGTVQTRDSLIPSTNASYSVSWAGIDLGDTTHYYRDIYMKGELRGFRLENYTSSTLPPASASARGRAVFATDNNKIYIDTGGSWLLAGSGKFVSDTSWSGAQTTQDFTVSATISDARNAIWQLCDNSNSYERIWCSIRAISATQVRITVGTALPAGSYRLIGVE